MSDSVVVALVTGGLATLSNAVVGWLAQRHHRKHEAVSTETGRVVARIEIQTNGKLEAALAEIVDLKRVIAAQQGAKP